jgi:coenzyme F420-reducing hydrogenase delta subunit
MITRSAVIHLFYCSNSLTDAEVQSLQEQFGDGRLKMLSLPCSGKMTIPYLLKAFEMGGDGVVICSCLPAECRNIEGSLRASKRAGAVDELMEEVGLGAGRVAMIAKRQGDLAEVIDGIESLLSRFAPTQAQEVREPVRAELAGGQSASGRQERRGNAA